jgi:hypothetical protein
MAKLKGDVSLVFDLVDKGPRTNIARDKDKMVGEAVWKEHRRKIRGRRVRRNEQQIIPSS